MQNIIKELRQGGNVRRMITYGGKRTIQHFQLNKNSLYLSWVTSCMSILWFLI